MVDDIAKLFIFYLLLFYWEFHAFEHKAYYFVSYIAFNLGGEYFAYKLKRREVSGIYFASQGAANIFLCFLIHVKDERGRGMKENKRQWPGASWSYKTSQLAFRNNQVTA